MLFLNSAARDFGLVGDMLGNPPHMDALGFQYMYSYQRVVMGLGCLDHRANIGMYCRNPGKQLTGPSNQLFQFYDGQAGVGSTL